MFTTLWKNNQPVVMRYFLSVVQITGTRAEQKVRGISS